MAESDLSGAVLLLVQEFQRSCMRQLHVRSGDFELFLSKDAHAPAPSVSAGATPAKPAPPPPAVSPSSRPTETQALAPPALPDGAVLVTAPNLGTFYRAPKPGAAPYVELGSSVAAGDKLCLIEVMKLFTAVEATVPGRIHAILVEDGTTVEAGQPLFALVPTL